MGQPAVSKGVKCTRFVLRRDFLGQSQKFGSSASSLPPPTKPTTPGPAKQSENGRDLRPKKPPLTKNPPGITTLLEADTSSNHMAFEFARTCKHLISESLEQDRISNCEFCRGEKLVEEAARNNNLLAEEDDLSLDEHSWLPPEVDIKRYRPNNQILELASGVALTTAVKPLTRLWRTLCSSEPEPSLVNPLVLASVRLGKISSRLLVYYPKSNLLKSDDDNNNNNTNTQASK